MPTEKFVIDNIIEKEKIRNREMRSAYEQRLLGFPRGSLTIRESKGRKYCYSFHMHIGLEMSPLASLGRHDSGAIRIRQTSASDSRGQSLPHR